MRKGEKDSGKGRESERKGEGEVAGCRKRARVREWERKRGREIERWSARERER